MSTITREYHVAFSISSYSFPVSEVTFQISVTCLCQVCRLRVAFKSTGVEVNCAVPTHPPRCVAGATRGFRLLVADQGDCRGFFERASLPKAERDPCTRAHATTDEWG